MCLRLVFTIKTTALLPSKIPTLTSRVYEASTIFAATMVAALVEAMVASMNFWVFAASLQATAAFILLEVMHGDEFMIVAILGLESKVVELAAAKVSAIAAEIR